MSTYAATLVSRAPNTSGGPTLTEVNRLVCSTIVYVDELNKPGSATLTCPLGSLTDDVKARLADLGNHPTEAWIYRDSTLVWAGEVQSIGVQDTTSATLNGVGLLGYTFRMGIVTDLVYTGVDQFAIAVGMVDQWQALAYGHYGIDTSGVGSSGVTRDRTYLQTELNNVGQRLAELGAVDDGFDLWVDPTTRALHLAYPARGTDVSAGVILDALNIASAQIAVSVAPGDLDTDVSTTGTSQGTDGAGGTLYSAASNTALEAIYGRSWASQTYSNVSEQATLDDHAAAYLAARGTALLQPGLTIRPRPTSPEGGFGPGDTVAYVYDAGLGLQSGSYRIAKVTTTVDAGSDVTFGLEFV